MDLMQIISLGSSCSVARQLQLLGKREVALPFDWVRIPDFDKIIDLIESGFDQYLAIENYEFVRDSDKFPLGIDSGDMGHSESAIYRHKLYEVTFFHDFRSNCDFAEQFKDFQVKQQRRIDRFYSILRGEKSLLFVRDDLKKQATNRHIERLVGVIKSINPDLDVHILVVVHNPKGKPLLLRDDNDDKVIIYDDRCTPGDWWRPNVPWAKLLLGIVS